MNKRILALLVLLVVVNGIFNSILQLHYDEAYYWSWGQNLALSYYDHPPMIGYLIGIASLFGHSEFWVRFPGLVTATITVLTLYFLAKKMFNERVAYITAILAVSCPMIQATYFIITPDTALVMFWALTLYAFYIGIFESKAKYIYLAGIFAGFGLMSKYTMILVFPSLFLFLLLSKTYRKVLLHKHVYFAFILAFVVFSPVIYWNYQHNWISFDFQFRHGIATDRHFNWPSVGNFIGGQFLIAGPILFLSLLYYTLKNFKSSVTDDKLAFLFWAFAFTFIFFGYCGLFQLMPANWTGPVCLSSMIFLAYWLAKFNNKWVYRSSLVLIIIVIFLTKMATVFMPQQMHNKVPALNTFYGTREKMEQVQPYLTTNMPLIACDYGNASRAWFYLQLNRVYVLDDFKFVNNYQYWNSSLKMPIKEAIYICDNQGQEYDNVLSHYFKNIQFLKTAKFTNVISDSQLYIYRVSN